MKTIKVGGDNDICNEWVYGNDAVLTNVNTRVGTVLGELLYAPDVGIPLTADINLIKPAVVRECLKVEFVTKIKSLGVSTRGSGRLITLQGVEIETTI